MEDSKFQKFIRSFKDKFKRNSKVYPSIDEYAFSREEMDELGKENKEKIKELKKDIHTDKKKEEVLDDDDLNTTILNQSASNDNLMNNFSSLEEENQIEDRHDAIELEPVDPELQQEGDIPVSLSDIEEPSAINSQVLEIDDKKQDNENVSSFIHLENTYQKLIMSKWQEIDLVILEKDILLGKDLLNHNYTITYADDAARFVHDIRKKYEVVLCYLIGFNNEKKGIYHKTIFSDHVDNEWRYLNYYVKLLEKIRGFKFR